MLNPLPPLPELMFAPPTAEITAKFHLWFQDDTVGELELTTRAAPIIQQLTTHIEKLTDDDLDAVRELSAAAYHERARRAPTSHGAKTP